MEEKIKILAETLKQDTGIEVAFFNLDGVCIAGLSGASETVDGSINGTVVDNINGRTLFSFIYNGKKVIGRIAGATEAQKNYASLIRRIAENYSPKDSSITREEFNRAILLGKLDYSRISAYTAKFDLPTLPCSVMIINAVNGKISDVIPVLENYGNPELDFLVKTDGELGVAYARFHLGDIDDYCSATEFAEYLAQSVLEETGIKLKIYIGGSVKSVADLSLSYSQALATVRMCKAVSAKGDIHSFKEYMLIKMFEDLPKYKLNEYLEVLMDNEAKEIFSDEDMVNTAEEFLENSLNVSETSRKLYMHRNTLMYRLDKIEKATGLNIRKFSDAITFRFITVLNKLVK
ncbi:MAG: helix-turn-helix domain-containing protein [Clostridia bacterium]|nr:helix-turn-helix domain-containing protein [Clostridia bacterium]